MTTTKTLAALLMGGVLWAAPALAQGDAVSLGARLERLESQLGLPEQVAESQQVAQAGGIAPSLAADFEIRLQRLERALSELTGRYEESTYQVGQLRDRLERLNADIDFRIQQLEKGGATSSAPVASAATPAAAEPPKAPEKAPAPGQIAAKPADKPAEKPAETKPAPAALPAGATPDKQYEHAFGLLRDAHYDQAEKAFHEFLNKHKTHALAGNAQYWLGETYYVRNKYAEAAMTFAEAFQKYPKGNKAPDSLLKLGLSLSQLNKRNEACVAFSQLPQRYPEAAPTVKKRAETERRKLNCS